MKNKKMLLCLLVVVLIVTSLAGCTSKKASPADAKKAVYLINGSLGDNSFFDSGQAGMDQLKEKYGLEIRTIECGYDAGQYEPSIEAAMQYADLIFAISYGFEDLLKDAADKYPNKTIVNLDTTVENTKKTITSVDFVEEESAYLAGVVAALTTTNTDIPNVNPEKIIGVVGGDVDPVVESFIFGYQNGAVSIDPEIKLEKKYLGDWEDTAKGKQAALQIYDLGADVIFQVAAGAGMGVLQAAGDRGLYAIGVDTNQNDIVPGHVVASDIKDVGAAILSVYDTIKNGTYKPGEALSYGLKSKTIDVVFDKNGDVLPQSILNKVAEIRQEIIDGKLVVEKYTGN